LTWVTISKDEWFDCLEDKIKSLDKGDNLSRTSYHGASLGLYASIQCSVSSHEGKAV